MKKKKRLTAKQKRNRRILRNWILGLGLILVLVFGLQFVKKQVIQVKDITVTGNDKVKTEKIIKASGLDRGAKMYEKPKTQLEGRVEALPYIKDAKLKRSLLGKVKISVEERTPIAQISFKDHYVFIDEDLRLLEKTMEFQPEYIKITGLTMKNLHLGSYLFYNDRQEDLREMLEALLKGDLVSEIQSIEIGKRGINLLTKGDIQVVFYSTKNGPYKVKQLAAVLEKAKTLDKEVTMILMDKGKDPIAVTEDVKKKSLRKNEDESGERIDRSKQVQEENE